MVDTAEYDPLPLPIPCAYGHKFDVFDISRSATGDAVEFIILCLTCGECRKVSPA